MSSAPVSAYYALACQDADGRRTVSAQIPCFPVDDADRISLVEINRRASAVYGNRVAVHRTYLAHSQGGRLDKVLYIGEMLEGDAPATVDLQNLPVEDPWLRAILSGYLRHGPESYDVEWCRPGWFRMAVEQLDPLLAGCGLPLLEYPEQYRCGRESALIRAVTTQGIVFCKKVAPGRAHELPVTALLRCLLPEFLPRLVEAPMAHGWLVSFEDGYCPLADLPDLGARVRAAQAYATLQRSTGSHLARILGAGALDWTPERIQIEAAELYQRIGLLIPRAKREAWQSHYERFCCTCRRLVDLRLPAILQHDDLHAANVLISDCGVKFLDWAYVSVGFPSFSVTGLLFPKGDWNGQAPAELEAAYIGVIGAEYSCDAPAQVRALRPEFGPFGQIMEVHRSYLSGRTDRSVYKAHLSNTLWNEGKPERTQ